MKKLTLNEKLVAQKMTLKTLERAFNKEAAQGIYLACSEAIFREIENSEWFQDEKPILAEYIETVLGAIIEESLRFRFEY